jgi:phosphoglycolate phosphatase-like HAD superfamily hydrolase
LKNIPDSIIFDVDGVLLDVTKSYLYAIKKTAKYLIDYPDPYGHNIKKFLTDDLIFRFRRSGRFNNDIDTTYAILTSILCKSDDGTDLSKYLSYIADKKTFEGLESVEAYLFSINYQRMRYLKEYLNYPGDVHNSIIARIFDEHYYGPKLFKKRYGIEAKYYFGEGLIRNEKKLINNHTMKKLYTYFGGKVGIVSGRSKLATIISLKSSQRYFNIQSSVFLDDESRQYSKPNPYGLKKCIKRLRVNSAFYVGDSVEDIMMAAEANKEIKDSVAFIGVCGRDTRSQLIKKYFMKSGAYFVAEVTNDIPNILNKVQNYL